MKKFTLLLSILLPVFTYSQIINIPDDYATIQQGIDASTNGDTILVDAGTYFENINFKGKAITLGSMYILDQDTNHINNTVINGSQAKNADSASVVLFGSGEDTTSVISGFTITEGSGTYNNTFLSKNGGGIFCWESGATIINNKIINNQVDSDNKAGGGGISCFKSDGDYYSIIENNLISDNHTNADGYSAYGGGIHIATNARIEGNTIKQNSSYNTASADGGGISVEQIGAKETTVDIYDNVIAGNSVEGFNCYGAGIYIFKATMNITNNLITENYYLAESTGRGAGVCYGQVIGNILIDSNEISYNTGTANMAYGGGAYIGQGYVEGTFQFTNNHVLNNSLNAYRAWGGGVEIQNIEKVHTITSNLFENNYITADDFWTGAGMKISGQMAGVTIAQNIFRNNSGDPGPSYGGGLATYNALTTKENILINANIFENNEANYGGGYFIMNTLNAHIFNNIFVNNTATDRGGAIRFRYYNQKDLQVSVEQPNELDNKKLDGKIRNDSLRPLVFNNTFIQDTANVGGAIYSDYEESTPFVLNSIFWENDAAAGNDIYNLASQPIGISYNNIDDIGISGKWTGNDNIEGDPLFVDDTLFHIDNFSPCFQTGIDSIFHEERWYYCPEFDFEGDPRPYDGYADIGADEYLTPVGINPSVDDSDNLLMAIYPNPFTTSTTIEYLLNQPQTVTITFYDQFGKLVDQIKRKQQAGYQEVLWSPGNLAEGIYYYRLETDEQVASGKVVLLW